MDALRSWMFEHDLLGVRPNAGATALTNEFLAGQGSYAAPAEPVLTDRPDNGGLGRRHRRGKGQCVGIAQCARQRHAACWPQVDKSFLQGCDEDPGSYDQWEVYS